MKVINKSANIFIYILLIINIVFVIGILVFNNSFAISNNINIGKYSEEVFSNIYNKGHIAISSIEDYNSNGDGFLDVISCPTNVTMSGSTNSGTFITTMAYSTGSIYCSGDYNGKELRIYYDENISDFKKAYYEGDIVDIIKNVSVGTTNIATGAIINGTNDYYGRSLNNLKDGNTTILGYKSEYGLFFNPYIKLDLGSEKNIGLIKIFNDENPYSNSWNSGDVILSNNLNIPYIPNTNLSSVRGNDIIEIDLSYFGLTHGIRYIEIRAPWFKYMDLREVEIYEFESSGDDKWIGNRKFLDSDSTLINFNSDGIGESDLIDDDFNSDNYKVTSVGDVHYPKGYEDDDVVPRKIIFGNVNSGIKYQNIFWNNFKINEYIDNNSNNDDNINIKIGDADNAFMHLDLYNLSENLYDLKILEFDTTAYQNQFTLLPIKSTEGKDLNEFVGYIQNDAGGLSLTKNKTGNEYVFDFKNKDYGIFLSNTSKGNIAYRLSAETNTGTGIYINPIDDSGSGTIDVMANDIIIGGEKNFIGENFVISGLK